jgi:N,N'-diacetyllegionaminate synthase
LPPDGSASGRRPVFVIAEIGSTHDGSVGIAMRSIAEAAACGADAVKFQTHIASEETLREAPNPPYFTREPRFDYLERTGFSREAWVELSAAARDAGLGFLSSPFSEGAVELLEDIGVEAYKVASGEVTNIPLLKKLAATGKPVFLSSGMSSWEELDRAVETLGRRGLTVMQCTSMYPCPADRVGLNVLGEMTKRYGVPVGLSDHTARNEAAVAAAVLGATAVEKHFTLSKRLYGSDAANAIEPDQFADLVNAIREVETMLTNPVDKDDLSPFRAMKEIFEKSVVTLEPISAGTVLERHMLGVKKPGTGMPPHKIDGLVGRRTAVDVGADVILDASHLNS